MNSKKEEVIFLYKIFVSIGGFFSSNNEPTKPNKKWAFAIDITDYDSQEVISVSKSVMISMSKTMKDIGFHVNKSCQQDYKAIKNDLDVFINSIEENDIVLFYFSGRGINHKVNFIFVRKGNDKNM